jgi:hypothetical protein
MTGTDAWSDVRKSYGWDLPADSSPEIIERHRRMSAVQTAGYITGDHGTHWVHPSRPGVVLLLDAAYVLVRPGS